MLNNKFELGKLDKLELFYNVFAYRLKKLESKITMADNVSIWNISFNCALSVISLKIEHEQVY